MKEKKYYTVVLIISVSYLFFVGLVNAWALEFPFALNVDVIGDLEHINQILDINSWKGFVEIFFKKNLNPYHGFITLLIPAFLGALPRIIWGEIGLIFSFHMVSAIVLITSYFLYVSTFIQNKYYRIAGLIILILLPYTNMFATWPRCESYLYLFTALFLYFEKRHPRASNFIFLGLAFISRISIAGYIPFFFILSFWKKRDGYLQHIFKRFLFLIMGILIAQPHLVNPKYTIVFITQKIFQLSKDTGINSEYNYSIWLNKFVVDYFGHPAVFYLIVLISAVLVIYLYGFNKRKNEKVERVRLQNTLVFFPAVVSLFLIMVFVKIENSGWYLQHHVLFILLIMMSSVECFSNYYSKSIIFAGAFNLFLASFMISLQFPGSPIYRGYLKFNFDDLWNKYRNEKFLSKVARYHQMKNFLAVVGKEVDGIRHIMVPGNLFDVNSEKPYLITRNWSEEIFLNCNSDCSFDAVFTTNEQLVSHNKLYKRWVVSKWGGNCYGDLCYEGIRVNSEIIFFYRKKSFPRLSMELFNNLN